MKFDDDQFLKEFNELGFVIMKDVLSTAFVEHARNELEDAIEKEVEWHGTRDYNDYGMVLLCSLYGGAFLELFDNEQLMKPFNLVLGEGCIVYAYTSSSLPPKSTNFSTRIHVDSPRLIPSYPTNMGATILLDDFKEENGATWFLPASHTTAEAPNSDTFKAQAKRLVAPAGSVFFFNARIWHTSDLNHTGEWRHALTLNMCRSFMKQRIDIPRAMAHMDLNEVSNTVKQKLGFLAQTPASYEEYYVPPEQRKFQQKPE